LIYNYLNKKLECGVSTMTTKPSDSVNEGVTTANDRARGLPLLLPVW
jgi:hypothetical protein